MDNKNIVILKRHFVNYKDVKNTSFYLNQCGDLADFEVIDVTSRNTDPAVKSDISPMYMGPVTASDGAVCNVFELFWQASKLYPSLAENGEPKAEYFKWRASCFAEPVPSLNDKMAVKRLRHINKEIGEEHSSALCSLWFDPESGKYEKLSYVEARKKIYIPYYISLVSGTDTFKMLKDKISSGKKIALLDFDGFNFYSESVKKKMYEKYTDCCRSGNKTPLRTVEDYLDLRTAADVVNCPFVRAGHAIALKLALQDDIIYEKGNVIDKCGILK